MKRKFTFLLMALLALAGFKSWGQETITVDFESGIPSGWTTIDADGDGNNWMIVSDQYVHGGVRAITSESYSNSGGVYYPDNYLISPKLTLGTDANMSFYAYDYGGYREHFGVFISTTGNGTSDFVKIVDWNFHSDNGFQQLTVDLSAYSNQEVYIAFRHYESVNQWRIIIDDITINLGETGTQYNIAYDQTVQHGSITGPATAYAGQTITVTATPDAGYALEHITVNGTNYLGNTFTMPEDNATVTATFVSGLTVNDGTDVYDKAPFYGEYANSGLTKSQFVIPASYLESIQGSEITQLKFYLDPTSSYNPSYTSHTWDVYINEMNDPSGTWWDFYNFETMTNVYSGSVSIVDNQLTITLDEPFQYNSNSLMIGFNQTNTGFSGVTKWIGSNNTTGSAGTYRCRAGWSSNKETMPFLPKTTFYTQVVTCPKPTGLNASNITGTGATISWTGNGAESYDLAYGVASTFDLSNPSTYTPKYGLTTTSVQLTGLTAETEYKCAVKAHCSDEDESAWSAVYSFTPTAKMTLTVNEGNTYNEYVPFYGYYADNLTKSQFIIPATTLSAMEGADISAMEFYTTTSGTNQGPANYSFGGSWDVYFKIVDHVEMPSSYEPLEGMDKVYTGNMVIANSKMTLTFAEPYTYEGGNLMICFNQTTSTSWQHTYWKGVTTGPTAAYAGYGAYSHGTYYFLPTTTFTYIPGATRYNVTVDNAITGGSISANPTEATAGTVVNLSATPAYGYEFGAWVENYEDVTIENNQFTMPEHDVTISATFNELTKYAINSAVVAGGTVHAEYDNVTITEAPEGTVITLVAEAAEDYIFEYFTVDGVQIEGNTYTMGTSAIVIGASFRAIRSYNINYYVNGELEKTLQCREDNPVNVDNPANVPTGVDFEGWGIAEIGTYVTERPTIIGGDKYPTDDYDLHAVFRYSEMAVANAWTKVSDFSELNDNDVVIIGAVQNGNSGYTMNEFSEMGSSATCPALPATFSNDGTTITELHEGTTHFTVTKNPYNYGDIYLQGESGKNLSSFWNTNLNIPAGWEEIVGDEYNDIITFDNGKLIISYNDSWDELYVILRNIDQYGGINMRFGVEQIQPGYYYAAYLYKQQGTLTTYYMTEVFVIAEATSLTENMTKRNVIIADGASLNINANVTLNVAGACFNPSHDAAQLVIADGGQLIHNNAGTVATMKKNITETDTRDSEWTGWYTISSPLANSVGFTNVTNLIPGNDVTDTHYDLYRLNEAEGIWENSRIEDQSQNEFTTIDKGRGYIYANNAGADHIAFAGEVNVEDAECTLTNGKTNGFNLIGNPFMQNITLDNVTGVILAGGFYVLSNQGDWGTKLTGDIKPLQGFLVQAKTTGNVTISKPTAAPSKGERSEQNTNIEMIVSNSNHRDNAFAVFGEGIGLNKVNHRNAEAPMLYIPQDGEKFAIAFMDENTTVFPLNFKAMTTGKYSISLKATDDINTLVLIDNMTGVETNMLLENSYSFNGSPADSDGRFTVKLSISHSNGQSDNEHFVYQNGKELVVNGEGSLQIFDVLGRVVISEEVHGQTVYVGNLSEGAYIVRMTGNEVKTQKIIIR